MKFSKRMLAIIAIVSLFAGLSGCANNIFIGVREGADRVVLAEANQVGSCQSKGAIIISVFAKFRIEKDVEANMYQMARNEAVDAGADTVVKGDSPEFGKRTFKLYKCRP
ncbi:hypothetical protein [Sideroxydans lithotrophicus]|uniref:Lipoprotein n=1 Tax=Sideroxydans lithotrophicus (strain ES-1) TaxID=580332 RepID=D5CNJ3_SIDLE|nr:hypothetical protein [Sideroxydans lithotrophicus]ADE10906.1 hypothetical protein Slit_0666 [Sideroxydans lithotrophicus ES-1]